MELGLAFLTVAEEAHTDALPIAGAHGEGTADGSEVVAIGAEGELVLIAATVVSHP